MRCSAKLRSRRRVGKACPRESGDLYAVPHRSTAAYGSRLFGRDDTSVGRSNPNAILTEREAEGMSPFIPWSFEPAGLQPR